MQHDDHVVADGPIEGGCALASDPVGIIISTISSKRGHCWLKVTAATTPNWLCDVTAGLQSGQRPPYTSSRHRTTLEVFGLHQLLNKKVL